MVDLGFNAGAADAAVLPSASQIEAWTTALQGECAGLSDAQRIDAIRALERAKCAAEAAQAVLAAEIEVSQRHQAAAAGVPASEQLGNPHEAAELVARWAQHWEEHGFGYWCVREQGSDHLIGYAGVKRMLMNRRPVLNLVYRFVPELRGRGHATEAASAVVSMTTKKMPAETIVARVRPDNRVSQNVALKVGLNRDP